MQELEELRAAVKKHDYVSALQIIDELEEISREDKLNKIYSYAVILLIHLIKQEAEQRTTSSWDRSILVSVDNIKRTNKRRKSGGYYADRNTLKEIIDEAYDRAIKEASFEAFEGRLSWQELNKQVDFQRIKTQAITLIE